MQLTRVAILASERWWGGAVVDADVMPLRAGYARDLRNLGGNQGASLMLSSSGRYVFCPQPFTVAVTDTELVIECASPVVVRGVAGGLREARKAAFSEKARPFAAQNYEPTERPIDSRLIDAPSTTSGLSSCLSQPRTGLWPMRGTLSLRGSPRAC
jgi:hypothetical protein